MGLGIVFSVFLFIVLATREGEPTKTTPKPPVQAAPARDPEYGRGIEVQSCAQLYVEGLLKSPRSAKHPWVLASDVVTKISEGQYRIRNYVDAENAYGAMLRQYYTCDVTLSGDRCSNVVCEFD